MLFRSDSKMSSGGLEMIRLPKLYRQDRKSWALLSIIPICALLALSVASSYAQTTEDYYKNKINKIKSCKGDVKCVERIQMQSRQKGQAILQTPVPSGEAYLSGKDLLTMDMNDLGKAVYEARFFRNLKNTKFKLERTENCGRYADRALETKEELEQLNLIRNKTTETYGRRAQEVKDENTNSLRRLETCYTNHLSLNQEFKYKRILTYASFEENYYNLVDRYAGIANLDEYIDRMERMLRMRMETAPSGTIVGALTSVENSVEVLPGGKGVGWIPVGQGYKLEFRDHLRTGAGSMARIKLADRYNQGKAQPTVISIGSHSHIEMSNVARANRPPKGSFLGPLGDSLYNGTISLIKGTLRALKKTLDRIQEQGRLKVRSSGALASKEPEGSTLSIRAGTSMGVMRGTELGVSYDPKTGIADYYLDHGDAYVESGGRKVTLTPRTSVTVKNNQISAPRMLSQAKWDEIVTNSGGGFKEGGAVAHLGTGKNKTTLRNNTPDSDIEAAAKARRRYARSVAGTMLLAMKDLDKEALLKVLAEPMHSDFRKALKKTSMQEMAEQTKGRPLSHSFRCSICNRKGDKCQVLADVQMEVDPIGQTKGILFDIERNGRGSEFKVADAPPVDDFMEKAFMAQNPVCGEE